MSCVDLVLAEDFIDIGPAVGLEARARNRQGVEGAVNFNGMNEKRGPPVRH